jgi:hypothetical protein
LISILKKTKFWFGFFSFEIFGFGEWGRGLDESGAVNFIWFPLGPSAIQKSSSSSKLEKNRSKTLSNEPTLAEKRDRLHTISVMSTSTRKPTPPKKVPKEILKSGLNPSFIFLQLYHTACFGSTSEVPLIVHPSTVIERAISILDRMYPYEVHKIGVLYIGEGNKLRQKSMGFIETVDQVRLKKKWRF